MRRRVLYRVRAGVESRGKGARVGAPASAREGVRERRRWCAGERASRREGDWVLKCTGGRACGRGTERPRAGSLPFRAAVAGLGDDPEGGSGGPRASGQCRSRWVTGYQSGTRDSWEH